MPRLLRVWRSSLGRRERAAPLHLLPPDRLTDTELGRVVRGIRQLTSGLNRGRRLVGVSYMDDPDLLGAYLLYFWPISYAQTRLVLRAAGLRPRSVLDLGSGPGPGSLAAFDEGAQEVVAADRSQRAIDLGATAADQAGYRLETRIWDAHADSVLPGGGRGFHAVLSVHALNELWAHDSDVIERRAALVRSMFGRLRAGGAVVLIEPALHQTTRDLLQVRDALIAEGAVVRAPCLFRGPCPALARPADWCHGEFDWTPPPALADIIGASGVSRPDLQMAYLVVQPPGSAWPSVDAGSEADSTWRVVSEPMEGKARWRILGCGPQGRAPISRPDGARSIHNQAFGQLRRGDVFRLVDPVASEQNEGWRVLDHTRVERLNDREQFVGADGPRRR